MSSQDERLRALSERLRNVSTHFDQNVVKARSLLDTISSNQESLEQENERLRALLADLIATEPVGYGAESSTRYCPYCRGCDGGSDNPDYDPVEHVPDCPWLQARAFLAR